jgi:hypothetical protein
VGCAKKYCVCSTSFADAPWAFFTIWAKQIQFARPSERFIGYPMGTGIGAGASESHRIPISHRQVP